jgi:hypothetical protein
MRSPNYPAYGLSEAIQMATTIWNKEERTVVSPEIAVKALGYQSLSGIARTKLSTLRKFGLLDETKNGGVALSDLAMKLIHHPPGSAEYSAAIREAALKPELYKELYGSHAKASDDAIRSFLKVEKAFSESGAGQFVEAFRTTLKLANLSGEAYNPSSNGKTPEQTPTVGDYVQWESQGTLQFTEPKRIREISEDGLWAFVDGSNTGVPVKQVTTADFPSGTPPALAPGAPPSPRVLVDAKQDLVPPLAAKSGTRQDVFSLAEGQVTIQWPSVLSKESFQDIADWLKILERKIGRSVSEEPNE